MAAAVSGAWEVGCDSAAVPSLTARSKARARQVGRMAHKGGGKTDHWIQGAVKHPGALHRELGVPEGKNPRQEAGEGRSLLAARRADACAPSRNASPYGPRTSQAWRQDRQGQDERQRDRRSGRSRTAHATTGKSSQPLQLDDPRPTSDTKPGFRVHGHTLLSVHRVPMQWTARKDTGEVRAARPRTHLSKLTGERQCEGLMGAAWGL